MSKIFPKIFPFKPNDDALSRCILEKRFQPVNAIWAAYNFDKVDIYALHNPKYNHDYLKILISKVDSLEIRDDRVIIVCGGTSFDLFANQTLYVYQKDLDASIPNWHLLITKHFDDVVPKFTRMSHYRVTVPWDHLENWITRNEYEDCYHNLDPDFQRIHVWDEEKQIQYVEYIMRGGVSGKEVYWNCTTWQKRFNTPIDLVDGKQRIQAVRRFMNGEIKAFGLFIYEYSILDYAGACYFNMCVNDLTTRAEVLQWYLDLNTGGVLHTKEELDKVKQMLECENV